MGGGEEGGGGAAAKNNNTKWAFTVVTFFVTNHKSCLGLGSWINCNKN